MALSGRRILVTRPAGQAQHLVASLKALGAETVEMPLLAIESLDVEKDVDLIQQAKNIVQQLDQYSKILFTSTNAVAHGMPMLDSYWPQWPIGLAWYGIGIATQKALAPYGAIVNEISSLENPMTTESLLALEDFAVLDGQKIVIVQGEGGRNALSPAFQQRGAIVDQLVCYRRVKPSALSQQWQQLDVHTFDALIISSGEALDNLLSLPGSERCKNIMSIMPSLRVANMAKAAGFENIVVAENASDAAMVKALSHVHF